MTVLLLTGDLLFGSRISEAMRSRQQPIESLASATVLVEKATAEVQLVLLDLSTAKLDLQELVPQLRQRCPAARIVAFGSHVLTEKLQAARGAGCDQVLTRGQLSQQLERGSFLEEGNASSD